MREDRLRELFDGIGLAEVGAPDLGRVLSRGRQRRRQARLSLSASALAIVVVAGFGAIRAAGHLAVTAHSSAAGRLPGVPAGPGYPVRRSSPPAVAPSAAPSKTIRHSDSSPRRALPAGGGPLILELTSDNRFVMTRMGSAGTSVPVAGLPSVLGGPSLLATNPAGGWVVTYTTRPNVGYGFQPARLALVTASGHSKPFGPVYFWRQPVTSAAVSPDGSRLAIALMNPRGSDALIRVLPMPGHPGRARTWATSRQEANEAGSLSWAPDGRRLTYIAQSTTGGGFEGNPETLDTTLPGSVASGTSNWPSGPKGVTCYPNAAAWLGTSGRFGAVEECAGRTTDQSREIYQTADPSTGAPTGRALVLSHQLGCAAGLNSSANGKRVLISYCGTVYLAQRGRLSRLPGRLQSAALAG